MARYERKRGSRYSPGGYGTRRGSEYPGRGSRYGRGRPGEDDEYEEEEPAYYGKQRKGKLTMEQISLIVLGVMVAGLLIFVLLSVAGVSVGVPTSTLERELGRTGPKAAAERQNTREMEASGALHDAESFNQANPYEAKEVVAEKYREVRDKYAGTRAAQEADQKYKEVMDRRR